MFIRNILTAGSQLAKTSGTDKTDGSSEIHEEAQNTNDENRSCDVGDIDKLYQMMNDIYADARNLCKDPTPNSTWRTTCQPQVEMLHALARSQFQQAIELIAQKRQQDTIENTTRHISLGGSILIAITLFIFCLVAPAGILYLFYLLLQTDIQSEKIIWLIILCIVCMITGLGISCIILYIGHRNSKSATNNSIKKKGENKK